MKWNSRKQKASSTSPCSQQERSEISRVSSVAATCIAYASGLAGLYRLGFLAVEVALVGWVLLAVMVILSVRGLLFLHRG